MQVLLVADLHYALKQYDWLIDVAGDYESVVIAGDLLEISCIVPKEAQIVVVQDYLRRLATVTRLLVCSGNHDLDREGPGGERIAGWLSDARLGAVTGDGAAVTIDGTLVSSVPWWEGPETQARIAEQLARDAARRTGRWIWLYHAPPCDSPVSWGGSRSYGDTLLNGLIETHAPDLVLSGHVHQAPFVGGGSWVDRIGTTWVFNMGQQPGPAPAHVVIDTEAGEAAWFSLEGRERVSLGPGEVRREPIGDLPDWIRAVDPDAGAVPQEG